MSTHQFSEEELRALEAEMEKITVDDLLLQTVVSLVNLGARRAGLAGPEGAKADLEQVRQAIEGARALMPLLEARHGEQLAPVRDALSRLQMAYVQAQRSAGGGEARATEPGGEAPQGESAAPEQGQEPSQAGPGPAQRSGRLWIPGQ
jgi:hypothetical protein